MPFQTDFFRIINWLAVTEETYPAWIIAFVFALVSGVSLPLGALLGIIVVPTPDAKESPCPRIRKEKAERDLKLKHFVGGCLAFGAGSLLFAVTVELYGKQMRRLDNHGYLHHVVGIIVTTLGAVLGGVIFTYVNRWLCQLANDEDKLPVESSHDAEGQNDEIAPLLNKDQLAVEGNPHKEQNKTAAGISMWLGVLIDGIPEGVLLGFLAAEHHLSMVLVVSLLVANFPEAFSSACLLREKGWRPWTILSLWTICFLLTAVLAAVACAICPARLDVHIGIRAGECFIEGLAGGAMLACATAVMLPEAFEVHKDWIGLLCLLGFLSSVVLKVTGGVASELVTMNHPLEEGYQEISVLFFKT